MFEHDYDDSSSSSDINETLARYEEMVKNHRPTFFDHQALEDLVEYYELKLDYDKALDVANYGIDVYPFSSVFITKKAGFFIQKKKYKEAQELLDQAATLDPNDIGIDLLKADLCISKSRHAEAVIIIDEAIRKADKDEKDELYLEKADVYEDWGLYNEVYECLKECLDLNHNNFEALSRMWYTVELAGTFEDSIKFHNKLLDRDPYSYLAWHNLGSAYYYMGLLEKAIEAYEFSIAINENYDLAYRECGDAYYRLKNYPKAIEYFTSAIEISKPYEDLHYAIGLCFERLKDYTKARSNYRKALNADPKFHPAFFRIGFTYKKEKHWQNALHFFKKALRLEPHKANYLLCTAEAYAQLGDATGVRSIVREAMSYHPQGRSKKAYKQYAANLFQVDSPDEAWEVLQQARDENKAFDEIRYYEAVACYLSGRYSEAYAALEEALFENPKRFKQAVKFVPEMILDPVVMQLIDNAKS